jgi:hypothetical protein
MQTATLVHADRLWTYMSSKRARGPCDAIVVCCSYDLRVCDYACALIREGLAPRLVLTGKTGNWTNHLWDLPEAQIFFLFPQDVSNVIGVFGTINEMVGDIDRVIRYPSRGFQIPHQLPPQILESWRELVAAGFVHHLLPDPAP